MKNKCQEEERVNVVKWKQTQNAHQDDHWRKSWGIVFYSWGELRGKASMVGTDRNKQTIRRFNKEICWINYLCYGSDKHLRKRHLMPKK